MLKLKKSASQIIRDKQIRDYFAQPKVNFGTKPNKTLYYMNRFSNFKDSYKTKKGFIYDDNFKFASYDYTDMFYRDIKLLSL